MKKIYKNLITIFLIIIVLTLINRFEIIKTNRQIIKEMTSSTLEENLNAQITALNAEHTEYINYIQTCKTKIATALTNEGVETSDQILLEEMAENISNILQARTSDATATADNITEGKTAYVNGQLIRGTGADNESFFEQGQQESSTNVIKALSSYVGGGGNYTRVASITHDLSSYEGYENFEINKNIFVVTTEARMSDSNSQTSAKFIFATSYDNETGILTLAADGSYHIRMGYTIYLVM